MCRARECVGTCVETKYIYVCFSEKHFLTVCKVRCLTAGLFAQCGYLDIPLNLTVVFTGLHHSAVNNGQLIINNVCMCA